jgi:hypothetical protein
MASPVLAAVSHASTPAISPLKKGLAFYKGQTLTEIEQGATGAVFDLIARTEAQWMGQYLHATINVEDITIGNTITGQDTLAHAAPTGLTIGELNLGNDAGLALSKAQGLNFNPTRLEFIAATAPAASLFIATKGGPFSSFSQFASTPSPTMLMENSGSADNQIASLFGVLGIHPKYITGYTSIGTYVAGFSRGDGPAMYTNIASTGPLVAQGKAVILATSIVPPVGTLYRSIAASAPTFAQLLRKAPTKTKLEREQVAAVEALLSAADIPVVTQTSVPEYKLDALRAAADWMFKQPGFRTQMLGEGENPNFVDPVKSKTDYATLLKNGALVLPYFQQFGL